MQFFFALTFALFSATVFAQEQWKKATARKGLTPDIDKFYKPPIGWQDKKPGEILRWREIEPKFLYSDFKVKEAYQLLYRTSWNNASQPSYTVTTVLVPYNARNDTLVAGLEAMDANAPQCAPSYGFLGGALDQASDGFSLDEIEMLPYLTMGHILTVPDHEGPKYAFAAGRLEGLMTLDGIRATLNFEKLGLGKNTKVAGYGYSGGALTLGWAAALHPSYAPDINAVGWAFGGTPTDVNATINHASGGLLSGFLISGVMGVVTAYSNVYDYALEQLTGAGLAARRYALSHCWQDVIVKYAFTDIRTKHYAKRGSKIFDTPAIQQIFNELKMYHNKNDTPKAPVLMYHAKNDEVIPYKEALLTAKTWCSHGADVHFITYDSPVLEHATTEVTATARSVEFLRDRLNGKAKPGKCQYEYSNTALFQPGVLGSDLQNAFQTILDVFGQKVGPGDKILKSNIMKKHKAANGGKHKRQQALRF